MRAASPDPCWASNLHPAEDADGVLEGILRLGTAVRARLPASREPLGVGLWLPSRAASELAGAPRRADRFRARLADAGLRVATANLFPAGGFHAARVKEAVYRPDWAEPARLEYTRTAARALARLVAPGTTLVASTLPGGWRRRDPSPAAARALATGLAAAAADLRDLDGATGVRIVLAPEPEPGCTLETADEATDFWRRDLPRALGAAAERLLPHLGICLDLAHASVAGDGPLEALRRLRAAGVPVAKVQASAALEVADPSDGAALAALAAFDEPRWLHQAGGRDATGAWRGAADLPEVFADLAAWRGRRPWRVHFHAPLHLASVAGVATTRDASAAALADLAAAGPPWPVVETETYTWSAVPGGPGGDPDALAAGIAAELAFARAAMGG